MDAVVGPAGAEWRWRSPRGPLAGREPRRRVHRSGGDQVDRTGPRGPTTRFRPWALALNRRRSAATSSSCGERPSAGQLATPALTVTRAGGPGPSVTSGAEATAWRI